MGIQAIGFLVAPWTTMVYALMWVLPTEGVFGWQWICVGLALLVDVGTWAKGRSLVRSL